ncbi:MAG: hypothetical protein E2604_12665 [Flavobacterium sp.]|nr:hypothetical protein [Flavobacterium sp.]
MEFKKICTLTFNAIPEFELFYKENLDEHFYYTFLGDFGLFVRDAIENEEIYAIKCVIFINEIVNEFFQDIDFINKMTVSVLEILTDYSSTQQISVKYFTGDCLALFEKILNSGFFMNLLETT